MNSGSGFAASFCRASVFAEASPDKMAVRKLRRTRRCGKQGYFIADLKNISAD
jgi:hypothetical protein